MKPVSGVPRLPIIKLLLAVWLCALAMPGVASVHSRMREELRPVTEDSLASAIVQEYASQAVERQDLERIREDWMLIDAAACRDYFDARAARDPGSSWAASLSILCDPDWDSCLARCRALQASAPDSIHAYELLAAAYQKYLFDPHAGKTGREFFSGNLDLDRPLLLKYADLFPNEEQAAAAKFELLLHEGDLAGAAAVLAEAGDSAWANPETHARLAARSGDFRLLEEHLARRCASLISRGELARSDSLEYFLNEALNACFVTGGYAGVLNLASEHPNLESIPQYQRLLAICHADAGDSLAAERLIDLAWRNGLWDHYEVLYSPAFAPLRELAAFPGLLQRLNPKQEEDFILLRKTVGYYLKDEEAPRLDFETMDGASLCFGQGRQALLIFGASWCPQCLEIMPVIARWAGQEKPEDLDIYVVVSSDPRPQDTLDCIRDNGLDLITPLKGGYGLGKSFGYNSLPYLAWIDSRGRLVFELERPGLNIGDVLSLVAESLANR